MPYQVNEKKYMQTVPRREVVIYRLYYASSGVEGVGGVSGDNAGLESVWVR